MSKTHKQLIEPGLTETGIRSFLVDGNKVSATLRIPDMLRNVPKEETVLHGTSFSAFVRTCMIEGLAKKGARA